MIHSTNLGTNDYLVIWRPSSELLLNWGPWDVVDTVRLLDTLIAWNLCANSWHLSVTDKWHSATAISGLWSHCVKAGDHGDDASIQKDEPQGTNRDNCVEQDLVVWLPLDVSILINLCRHTGCARSHQNHDELDEK